MAWYRMTKNNQLNIFLKKPLDVLVSRLAQEYGPELVSIALFGSASTGEWVKGKSDIDLIIVVRQRSLRNKVENSANRILLEIDKKYDLKLTQTCSTFVKRKNFFINLLYKIENILTFGKPFYVFSIDQIVFEKGVIHDAKIRFITAIFDPVDIFFAKMKYTGLTIYGHDLIGNIRFSSSVIQKARVAFAPFWLLLIGILAFPFDEAFALRHSIKATIWACEDSLFAMDFPLSTAANEAIMIAKIFSKYKNVNLDHLKRTISLKYNKIETDITKGFVAKHIIDTIFFILNLYWHTSLIIRRIHLL